jgi:hypothetical protein
MNIEELRNYLREHGLEGVPIGSATIGTLADFISWSPENTEPLQFVGGDFPGGILAIVGTTGCEFTTAKFSDAFAACTDIDLSNSQILNLTIPATTQILTLNAAGANNPLTCTLPVGLHELDLNGAAYNAIPALPAGLLTLDVSACTNLTALPALPDSLDTLDVGGSALASLPALASTHLEDLDASYCGFTTLPALPATLTYLAVSGTPLSSVPTIPATCTNLYVNDCNWNSAKINSLLAQLVANAAHDGDLEATGTNGAPTGAGLTDKATLISRGWTVATN